MRYESMILVCLCLLSMKLNAQQPSVICNDRTKYELLVESNVEMLTKNFNSDEYHSAMQELKCAAKKGSSLANYSLGALFEQSELVPNDLGLSVKYYMRAAELGDMDAMLNLGVLYIQNFAFTESDNAIYWLSKARDAGHPYAEGHLDTVGRFIDAFIK